MDWYKDSSLEAFLGQVPLDGIELFLHGKMTVDESLRKHTKGIHLTYYPTWIDFYAGNPRYKEDFPDEESLRYAFGGSHPNAILERYREEHQVAKDLGVGYMVFHVGHVQLKDVFRREFAYSDQEVLDQTIDLVNKVFVEDSHEWLLFENLWWPGLNLLDKDKLEYFMGKINYKKKGLMLDLSHLLLTDSNITSYGQAKEYIMERLRNLGDACRYIKGIHINYSKHHDYLTSQAFKDNRDEHKIYSHIGGLDQHLPYEDEGLKDIIDFLQPLYKVIEVKAMDKDQWEGAILKQMRYL